MVISYNRHPNHQKRSLSICITQAIKNSQIHIFDTVFWLTVLYRICRTLRMIRLWADVFIYRITSVYNWTCINKCPPATGGPHIFSHSSNHPSAEAAKRLPGQLHAFSSSRPGVREWRQTGVPAVTTGKVTANCHVYCTCCACDYDLRNSKEQSPSCKTDSPSPSHKISRTVWNPKVRHRFHNSTPLVPMAFIQSTTSHLIPLRSILISSSHLYPILSNGFFPSGFPTSTLYAPLLSSYVLHAPPISSFLIWLPGKLIKYNN